MNTSTLSNGIRIIHHPSPTNVAYCGIAIDAGTRDELPSEYGIAHFCEHMLFKGTNRRSAWHILNRMERVGGDLNAYTTKEETVVYAAFMKEHLDRAVELICDVVFNSTFPQHEMDKEAEVIVEEIESYHDSPADLIFDDFENMLFKGHALGHDILGDSERIRSYRREDIIGFTSRLYRPERMIFFVFGDYDFRKVEHIVEKYTSLYSHAESSQTEADVMTERLPFCDYHQTIVRESHDTHQAHVLLGCPAYDAEDDRRIALYFLNNIIGGPGMNSLLNLALREHSGLVYTVESTLTNYTDTSTFAIYFGCDPHDVEKCLRIVRKEFDKLMSAPIDDRRYRAYMKQIKGQIGVACDNFESLALDMAKSFLHYGKFDTIEETYQLLDMLNPQLLHQVANEILTPDHLSQLIYH